MAAPVAAPHHHQEGEVAWLGENKPTWPLWCCRRTQLGSDCVGQTHGHFPAVAPHFLNHQRCRVVESHMAFGQSSPPIVGGRQGGSLGCVAPSTTPRNAPVCGSLAHAPCNCSGCSVQEEPPSAIQSVASLHNWKHACGWEVSGDQVSVKSSVHFVVQCAKRHGLPRPKMP